MSEHPHGPGPTHPPYPVGLLLAGRRVVVVGAGRVAARRLPAMVESGADVQVVAPAAHPGVRALAGRGSIELHLRTYEPGDLDGAWYAMAATDEPAVNAAVSADAVDRRIFCVRADDALEGSAWTPASGHHGDVTVAVLADRDPRLSARTRDALLAALAAAPGTTGSR